ncbi:glycoside hydrolase family 65 protein [Opitutaceae bacterium TAV4]|nr:glycoside hydrolase family 65 protein [Opitutaceae bacterium TAV4]
MRCIGVGSAKLLSRAERVIQHYGQLVPEEFFTAAPEAGWVLEDCGFDPAQIVHHGNKYLLGNGLIGCRGTMEEFGASELVGLTIAGLYDKVGDAWREPVNAPNPFFTRVRQGDVTLGLSKKSLVETHRQTLDLRRALHSRETIFPTSDGNHVTCSARRFLSLAERHLLVMEYQIHSEKDAALTLETGIDPDIWDINGPHLEFEKPTALDGATLVSCRTRELGVKVVMAERIVWDGAAPESESIRDGYLRRFVLRLKAGQTLRFWKFAAIFTGNDGANIGGDAGDPQTAAVKICRQAAEQGFAAALQAHTAAWADYWRDANVEIEGDNEAQFALRYSIYHLLAIAPGHSGKLSIPARGLSGQVYKGAVFWDTEMFMLPFFQTALPGIAKNLLLYRCHTLEGARRKAVEYGFEGAFFAWESQETGDDACTHFNVPDVFTGRPMRTYFRDKQIHISAAVASAMHRYLLQTGDESLLLEGGAEVIFECARFYRSYAYYKPGRARFEFLDVTGPDEYHERVHNNAYTNRMVRQTFLVASEIRDLLQRRHPEFFKTLSARLNLDELFRDLPALTEQTYIPPPDAKTGVIPQFDGYQSLEDVSLKTLKTRLLNPTEYLGGGNGLATSTRILKQADVVLMLSLFPEDHSLEIQRANWDFYEPRTEHGSSLSACAYGCVAARLGKGEAAQAFFRQSATIDLTGKSKQYIGELYIGGTHPAANGGAWMVAILGFAGLGIDENGFSLQPRLPAQWQMLRFRCHWRGQAFTITLRPGAVVIDSDASNTRTCACHIGSDTLECAPDKTVSYSIPTSHSK